MKQNISRLHTLPNYIISLTNGALNSKPWTIYRLWHKYLKINYGTLKYPFDRFDGKIPEHLKQGIFKIFIISLYMFIDFYIIMCIFLFFK